ncbi:hypothetical protein CAEBREN_16294 [Caenorhabditis brenneri]|uniref:Uncharacterized protein n=1 Tax=Caenorhabditis brenneri TaxID=135651 RepID=G0MHI7_CAEBE|nr:hypothetical protein CAEBREN_16294 [Caenorhabditis brenneri]
MVIVDIDENGKEYIVNCLSEFEKIKLWSCVTDVTSDLILRAINGILKASQIHHWFAQHEYVPPRKFADPDLFVRMIKRLVHKQDEDMDLYERMVMIRIQLIFEGYH